MVDGNPDLNRRYVYITRRVAEYIISQLVAVERDASNDDETGYLDRMNPELGETHWMFWVVRLLSNIRHILEYNSENPIHRLIIAGALIEEEDESNSGN